MLVLNLVYERKAYKGNVIKFPVSSAGRTNGTWRLQMNGVAKQTATHYHRFLGLLFDTGYEVSGKSEGRDIKLLCMMATRRLEEEVEVV